MVATSTGKRSLRTFYYAWGILTVIGVLLSIWIPKRYMPHMMSNDGHLGVTTMILFSILASPVAAGVYAAALHILRHHRYKGDGVPPAAEQVRENTKLTVTWLTASAILTVFVLVWGLGRVGRGQCQFGQSAGGRRDGPAVGVDIRVPGNSRGVQRAVRAR